MRGVSADVSLLQATFKNFIEESPHNHTLFSPTHTPTLNNTHPTKQNHGSYQANRTKVHRRQGPAKAARHQSSPKVRPTNSKPTPSPPLRASLLINIYFLHTFANLFFFIIKSGPRCEHPPNLVAPRQPLQGVAHMPIYSCRVLAGSNLMMWLVLLDVCCSNERRSK